MTHSSEHCTLCNNDRNAPSLSQELALKLIDKNTSTDSTLHTKGQYQNWLSWLSMSQRLIESQQVSSQCADK